MDSFDTMFNPENFSAREKVNKWVNIKEKIGTRCHGFFLGFWEKPAEGVYRRSISIALQDPKDPAVVYGVTIPEYYEKDVQKFLYNDQVGVEYFKDNPPKEKGLSPTKVLRMINLSLNERAKNGVSTPVTQTPVAAATTVETEAKSVEDENPF